MSDAAPERPIWGPAEVGAGPPGTRFSEVHRFPELDSTNRYLLDLSRRRPTDGLVAVADHQTAGRGRLGRSWEAPAGANLLASVLLVPQLEPGELHLCTFAVALAAAEACYQAASLEVTLKWPNDLVVSDRKLAGILAESAPIAGAPGAGRAVVVGIGLNVQWPAGQVSGDDAPVPEELQATATSIGRETGLTLDPAVLLRLLLVDLDHRLDYLDSPIGRRQIAEQYRRRCSTLGQQVRVVLADDELVGEATGITAEGHLVVDSGTRSTTISSGDVLHLRREG